MSYEQQAALLKAMGHPVRLQILNILRHGETCMCHLEKTVGRRQAYVSQQLMLLRQHELVERRQVGVYSFYRISNAHVMKLLEAACDPVELNGLRARDDCTCGVCEMLRMRDRA